MRAKEVLMSKATTKKAQEVLQKLIDVQDDERIFLEDGTIDDFFEQDEAIRQTFEYEKNVQKRNDRAKSKDRKRYHSN